MNPVAVATRGSHPVTLSHIRGPPQYDNTMVNKVELKFELL